MEYETAKLHEVVMAYSNISQAVAFTTNEVALFYALLQSWNAARRPAVIEQWASMTCHLSGLTDKTLSVARNKLVQRGVLDFHKVGNRGIPRYSFYSLLGRVNPLLDDLPANRESKSASKWQVSGRVNGYSYQKDKNKDERDKGEQAHDPLKFIDEIDSEDSEAIKPRNYPTLDQVLKFAKSSPVIIPEECARTWFYDMEACDWVDKFKRPINKWQAALNAFASRWNQFNKQSTNKGGSPAHPKAEYVRSL